MSLQTGDKLGPYEILEVIGRGGMGEVYRGRDPRLGRDVAIKVSAERFSERFERECRAVAALNHPNICTVYDVGPNYLVMELIQGESPKGPLPLEEALSVARQMADALEAAHENGIVHRDLKPANIKITPDGRVKVLDFGLAKAVDVSNSQTRGPESVSTWTMGQTEAGVILGTAPYMSPEQARGEAVDKRTDIWAFGVVVYELISGVRPFRGDTVSETLAAVLKEEPDWDRIPLSVRVFLQSCLKKDRRQRLHDIADARFLIDPKPAPPARRSWLWPVVAAAVLIALLPANLRYLRQTSSSPSETLRFQILPPTDNAFAFYLALSPDGRRLAFTAMGQDGVTHLWVRSLDSLEPRQLPDTEGAGSPFWSPDSRFIAFSAGARLRKVEASGASPAQTLCEVPGGATAASGAWSAGGVILFGTRGSGPIRRVSADGGPVTVATAVDTSRSETIHGFPWFLPDGKRFIYFRNANDSNVQGEYVGSIDVRPEEQPSKRFLAAQYGSLFVPSTGGSSVGQLFFLREDTLMVQPFDTSRLELTGEPLPVVDQVATTNVYAHFSASANGTLAYRSGSSGGDRQLAWFDRRGEVTSRAHRGRYLELALSPHGNQAAAYQLGQEEDLWVLDFTPVRSQRFTFGDLPDRYPVWSPDGKQIAFCTGVGSAANMFRKNSANTGEPEALLKSACPQDWSRDGKFILYTSVGAGNPADLWVLPLVAGRNDAKPKRFLATPFTEYQARFSPDGRWIAYVSNESGPYEVYVRPFAPSAGSDDWVGEGKWQISTAGGYQPRWSGSGKELMFLSSGGKLMTVDVAASGNSLSHGLPKPVFDIPIFGGAGYQTLSALWDMTPDGQHFLATTQAGVANYAPITIVRNWSSPNGTPLSPPSR